MGRPKKLPEDKTNPKDELICKICGGSYQRRNRARHIKTAKCLAYADIEAKIKKFILKIDTPGNTNLITLSEFRQMLAAGNIFSLVS